MPFWSISTTTQIFTWYLKMPDSAAHGPFGLKSHLAENGGFDLWSNDPPYDSFTTHLRMVFADAGVERVVFANPYQDKDVTQTIYLAR